MNRRTGPLFVLFAGACAASAPPPPQTPPPAPVAAAAKAAAPGCRPPPPEPAGAPQIADEGTFRVMVSGQPAGQETFKIVRYPAAEERINWTTSLDFGGMKLKADGSVATTKDGKPLGGSGKTEGAGADGSWVLTPRQDGVTSLCVDVHGQPPRDQVASGAIDLFLPSASIAPVGALCRLAGEQARTVTAFPGMEVKLAPVATRRVEAPGRGAQELRHVVADVAGAVRVELLCDGPRLLALRQAITSTSAVRQGFEHLAAVLETADRAKPATPPGVVELERKVASADGVSLACSLALPKSHADVKTRAKAGKTRALPAVVFVTGSGAQDRDEDTVGPGGLKLAIFKTIAMDLAQKGIASLRCDDRGTGASTGEFGKATLDSFVADADATLAALRAEPAIDPGRTGLVGHSEGAVVGPIVAAKDAKLRGLVLLAGPGRPLDAIIVEQTETALRRGGTDDATAKRALDEARETYAAIKKGEPLPARLQGAERAAAEAAVPWLKSHFTHDVLATAAQVKRPSVLVAQGAKDAQVSVKDAELLRDALARAPNKRVTFKVYPDLNHLFSATTTGSLADYSDPKAEVDPGFRADVVAFLKKAL